MNVISKRPLWIKSILCLPQTSPINPTNNKTEKSSKSNMNLHKPTSLNNNAIILCCSSKSYSMFAIRPSFMCRLEKKN